MDNSIRVLFYEPYPMGLGGNFLTQKLILERLDRDVFYPIVVAPIDGVALDYFREMKVECVVIPPSGNLKEYGGTILRAGILRRFKSAIDLVKYNFKMSKFLRKRKIDIVYSNCVRAQLSIGLGARLARIPSLLYVKGVMVNPIIDRLSLFLSNKILFFCSQNRDDRYPFLTYIFSYKIDILKIGLDAKSIENIDCDNQSTLRKDLNISQDCINVAVLGQLYRPKGQHFAIEALARLIDEFPQVRLYLVGDHVIKEYIPYKEELDKLVNKYKLSDYVYFTGWRMDALKITSLMDIVIHPSLAEGFGRAVLESMALGKPVIASAVGGLREAIQDGENGYLVTPGDVDAITARWRALISDQSLRKQLGKNAKQTVFTNYLIDDKVDKLSKIWASMVKRNN